MIKSVVIQSNQLVIDTMKDTYLEMVRIGNELKRLGGSNQKK